MSAIEILSKLQEMLPKMGLRDQARLWVELLVLLAECKRRGAQMEVQR